MLAESAEILGDEGLDEGTRRQMGPVHAATLFYGGRVAEAHELIRRIRPPVPLARHSDEVDLVVWCMVSIESGQDRSAGLPAVHRCPPRAAVRGVRSAPSRSPPRGPRRAVWQL